MDSVIAVGIARIGTVYKKLYVNITNDTPSEVRNMLQQVERYFQHHGDVNPVPTFEGKRLDNMFLQHEYQNRTANIQIGRLTPHSNDFEVLHVRVANIEVDNSYFTVYFKQDTDITSYLSWLSTRIDHIENYLSSLR